MRRIAVVSDGGCRVQAKGPGRFYCALQAGRLCRKRMSIGVAVLLLGNQRCGEQRAIAQIEGET